MFYFKAEWSIETYYLKEKVVKTHSFEPTVSSVFTLTRKGREYLKLKGLFEYINESYAFLKIFLVLHSYTF